MVPPEEAEGGDRPALLIANHRGESLSGVRARLAEHGWTVAVSGDLATTREQLERSGVGVALLCPLTLDPESLEWQVLRPRLSPAAPVPWLVAGWEQAATGRLAGLAARDSAVADWVAAPAAPAEVEARLRQLLRLQRVLEEAQRREARLADQLITDHKTGLCNDRHFRARLREEFERAGRHGQPLTVLLVDVDDFKIVNDRLSYEAGDGALRQVGAALKRNIRSIDLGARIGGDEFAVLLPNTTLAEGIAVSNRIREAAGREPADQDGVQVAYTVSAGVASYEGRGLTEPRDLFLLANEALKAAKRSGKNRICFHDPRSRGLQVRAAGEAPPGE